MYGALSVRKHDQMPIRLLDDRRRPTKLTWIAGGALALLAVGGVATAAGYEPSKVTSITAAASTPTQETNQSSPIAPTRQAEHAPAAPLAEQVDAELKAAWGVTNFTDGLSGTGGHDPALLNWRISHLEDQAPGIVHVTIQVTVLETSEAEVEQLAKNIMRLSQDQLPALQWVAVQTADGRLLEQTTRLAPGQ